MNNPSFVILKIFLLFFFLNPGAKGWAEELVDKNGGASEKKYSFEHSVGYDTEYVFRGVSYADDLAWVQTAFNYTINETFSFWMGGLLATDSSGDYSEVDVMGEFGITLNSLYIGFGLNNYFYPTTGESDEFEIGLNLEKSFGESPFSLTSELYYSPELKSVVWTGGTKMEDKITDQISIEASAAITYNHRYWIEDSDWNNIDWRLSMPVTASSKLTITPYIALSIPLAPLTEQEAPVLGYGGVSATFSF